MFAEPVQIAFKQNWKIVRFVNLTSTTRSNEKTDSVKPFLNFG